MNSRPDRRSFLAGGFPTVMVASAGPAAAETVREPIEIGAPLGLVLGVVLGAIALQRTLKLNRRMQAQIDAASAAFHALMQQRFDEWGLTPAERDVAFLALKGCSIAEIARLRETSEGTVKAQTNAIYRKAGVSGRAQLLSLFLDDLMGVRP
ncbi:regulatory protein, luxR family [Meinhardsimonia xiamenensis]|uniref:Regulatory protein, luxR family n=1 Tax=Meinhardsimonia xiamenensis TaxID=990712 RepID=A0A1G8Z639_9RHOB|nr:helix-turn-helix transcriptional regulator [Meinhardsimonia xiamenensis]PRX37570.1 regulatory LuxR family protein [Meinhardsimonia xiamenensis]SDK10536.1 regulatory protein, luxR family [Meinhardsimonia xiamenensis]